MSHTLINQAQKFKLLIFSSQKQCWMSTTCFTSMYKNIFNHDSKLRLLLLSSIATMLAKTQGENKQKQKVKAEISQVKPRLESIFKSALFGHILKKSAHSFFGAWSFLLIHSRFTPIEGPKNLVNRIIFLRSWTMENGHLPWSDFMVHRVNWPSYLSSLHDNSLSPKISTSNSICPPYARWAKVSNNNKCDSPLGRTLTTIPYNTHTHTSIYIRMY